MDARSEAQRLYQEEHLSPSEIAEKLSVSSGTIRSWKKRDNWDNDPAALHSTATQRNDKNQKQKADRTNDKILNEIDAAPGFTDLERDFCMYYIGSYNATQSAIKAGYTGSYASLKSLGYEMLRKPRIRDFIDYLKKMKRETIMAGVDDVIELHMRIAFSDITQFAKWTYDGALGNCFILNSSDYIDGNLVKEVKETEKGMSLKLEDRQKSLDFLERYFLINPMDQHKKAFEEKKLVLEEKKIDVMSKEADHTNGSSSIWITDSIWRGLMNDVYAEHLTAQQPTQVFFGGSSSGKSFAILGQRTVRDIMTGDHNYLICRKTGRTNRTSTFNEIKKCIGRMDLECEFSINKTDLIITHKSTGSQILFVGLDDVEKVKSITPQVGVITDIIVEEATEIEYNDYKKLQKRLRGGSESIIKRIVLLFNPILQDHWIYTELFAGKWDDSKNIYCDDKLLILRTTYKDNRWLTKDDIEKLENETDIYYYNVYTLGLWGVLGNLIFKNWKTESLADRIKTINHFYNGLDFGFFPDPLAYIRCSYDRAKKEVLIFMTAGGQNMTNDETAALVKPVIRHEVLTCDNAEPKSIRELNNFGINAIPAVKGPGSVEFSIKWLQKQTIIIDPRCIEIINEMKKYKLREDKNGNVLPEPVDRDNHWIDALRYALEHIMVETRVT